MRFEPSSLIQNYLRNNCHPTPTHIAGVGWQIIMLIV